MSSLTGLSNNESFNFFYLYKLFVQTGFFEHLLLKVSTDNFPSDEAHARIAPSSWGAHEIEFTGKEMG